MVEQNSDNQKLVRVRAHMQESGIDAYVCMHTDSHSSEYIAPCDERIAFLSGFKGSNGLCVVTKDEALMWTDSRYYIAAGQQLEAGWEMRKMSRDDDSWFEFLKKKLVAEQTVGIDFKQYPASAVKTRAAYFTKANIKFEHVENIADRVWAEPAFETRPTRPVNPVKVLDLEFCGKTSLEKQAILSEKMKDVEYDMLLVTTLDDICWLTNMRGTDIEYNPVFFAYLVFTPDCKKERME